VDAILGKALETLKALPAPPPEPRAPLKVAAAPGRRSGDAFSITLQDGVYVLEAPAVERLVPMANMRDERAILQIWRLLQRMGAVAALEARGVEPGDTVRLGGVDLEWY
jgi:GTP-binding protein